MPETSDAFPQRFDRFVDAGSFRAAGLCHVGTSAAAVCADKRCHGFDQTDGRIFAGEVVGNADNGGNFAFVAREQGDDAAFDLFLDFVDKGFQLFGLNVINLFGDEFDAVDGFDFVLIVGGFVADKLFFEVENFRFQAFLSSSKIDSCFQVVGIGF